MVGVVLDDNKIKDDGDGKENGKKQYVYVNKQQRYFVHLFAVVAPLRHETS